MVVVIIHNQKRYSKENEFRDYKITLYNVWIQTLIRVKFNNPSVFGLACPCITPTVDTQDFRDSFTFVTFDAIGPVIFEVISVITIYLRQNNKFGFPFWIKFATGAVSTQFICTTYALQFKGCWLSSFITDNHL